jgi:hypothetical protein
MRHAREGLVNALVVGGCMEYECVGVVLSLLIQSGARRADGKLRDEVRSFEGEKIEKVPLPLLEVRVGPHGGE